MFELIMIIIFIYIIVKKAKIQSSNIALFYKVMKKQNFTNVTTVFTASSYTYIKADLDGENFLFEVKTNSNPIGINELNSLYEMASKSHIHNYILVVSNNQITQDVKRKIDDYNIEVWDTRKLLSLVDEQNSDIREYTYKQSVLHTSNTSNDKCKIEPSYDPIQDGANMKYSIFESLFNKPDRL